MNNPNWFPNYAKPCIKAIELLEDIPSEGIFFVEFPDLWTEEITGLLNGFFTQKTSKFIKYDDKDFTLNGEIDKEFKDFIEGISFETGPKKYCLKIISDASQNHNVKLLLNNQIHEIENSSHLTLLQSIRVVHFLLQKNLNCVCFQIRTDSLGIETCSIINNVFSYLHNKLKNTNKNLIIFYSDTNHEFTKNYIWKSDSYYKSFAIIDSDDSYKILDYETAIEQIKMAILSENLKRLELFLGAGAGIESGLPSGKTMLLKALQELTNNHGNENIDVLLSISRKIDHHSILPHANKNVNLEHVMTLMKQCNKHDDLTQTEVIKDFEDKHIKAIEKPSSGYKKLKEISQKNVLILAATTNFDQLLEWSLSKAKVIVDEKTYEKTDFRSLIRNSDESAIVKLHGCRTFPYTLGITSENIQELPAPKKEFLKEYLSTARNEGRLTHVFFIGYNFADPDILMELTRDIERLRIHPIIVNPKKTETIRSFMNQFEKKTNRTTHIPFNFDFFMEVLINIIKDNEKK